MAKKSRQKPGFRAAVFKNAVLAGILLVVLAVVVYLPSWQGEFLWDDDTSVTESEIVKDPGGWWRAWVAPPPSHPDYFPLTTTSYWVEWRLWGANPAGYRVTNILLHAACAVLLWRLLKTMGLPAAWWAAAIFAVHPVNVESVAWIAERKNLLAMVFAIPAFIAFVKWEEVGEKKWYGLSLLCFVLALSAKASVVALPLVFLGFLWWKRGRLPGPGDLRAVLPFLALSLAFGCAVMHFQHTRAMGDWVIAMPGFADRLAGAAQAYWFYAGKAVWPFGLATIYPWHPLLPPFTWLLLAGTILLGISLLFSGDQRLRALAFGLGAYGLLLAPALGLVKMSFMRYSLVADHFQHLALPALVALVVCGCASLGKSLPPVVGKVIAASALATLSSLSLARAALHAKHETLWRDALDKNPSSPQPYNVLGSLRIAAKDFPEAEKLFRTAYELAPGDPVVATNLGFVCRDRGRIAEARQWFRIAISAGRSGAKAYVPLAVLSVSSGDLEGGLALLSEGANLYPDNAEINSAAGASFLLASRPAEALPFLLRCQRLNPRNPHVLLDLSVAYEGLGDRARSQSLRREALRIDPGLRNFRQQTSVP